MMASPSEQITAPATPHEGEAAPTGPSPVRKRHGSISTLPFAAELNSSDSGSGILTHRRRTSRAKVSATAQSLALPDSNDLFAQQRLRFISNEIDALLMPATPRGTLSDRTGVLKICIEGMVKDAVTAAVADLTQRHRQEVAMLNQRIQILEEKLGMSSDGHKTLKASFREKLLKKRGKSPTRERGVTADKLFLGMPNFSSGAGLTASMSSGPVPASAPPGRSLPGPAEEKPIVTISMAPSSSTSSPTLRSEELFKEAAMLKAKRSAEDGDTEPLVNVFDHIDHFQYEIGGGKHYRSLLSASDLSLIDAHLDENYYLANFFGLPQTHYYVADDPAVHPPVLITVLDNNKSESLGLVRTQAGDKRIKLTETNRKKRTAELFAQANLHPDTKLFSIDDEKLTRRLISLEHESINEHRQYKFGILLAHDDQTEDEMFANETTPAFEDFLSFLGARVELQGWKKYRAGLDTKHGTTGTHSLYQGYDNHQIMFHVSTMLPREPPGSQQLERKRHLGNDLVLIVFHDGVKPFDPILIHSHFNFCFIIVREVPPPDGFISPPEEFSNIPVLHAPSVRRNVFYRFAMAVKSEAPMRKIIPFFPTPPIMRNNLETLQLLLVKLINAERAIMHAPEFMERSARTRRLVLANIIEEFCKGKGNPVK
jgi:RAP1 GTPase activating protein 1